MMTHDPNWTAPRDGQDWRDDDVLRVTEWLRSFVPAKAMEQRLDAAKTFLVNAKEQVASGGECSLYDPADTIAWYIFQAETFAIDRQLWVPEEMVRIVPLLTRLGKELDLLKTIEGMEARVERLMLSERGQPQSGIFELLVGLAYRRHGWNEVKFVPEQPGICRTPDLHVSRARKRWAVECKRLTPSTYAAREKARGVEIAKAVHQACRESGKSVIVEVKYSVELNSVPDDYLVTRVLEAIERRPSEPWLDEIATGRIRPVDWPLIDGILEHDFVYYGSSRMIELLSGYYIHEWDHSMAATWNPAPDRPFYADAVEQASVVSWISNSKEAHDKKTRHFKSTLANAEGQLPADRPGLIHVGIESGAGNDIAATRHIKNYLEARFFRNKKSRLRWVYGNYFVPEMTTQQNESWAITETMVPYKIGLHRTASPLPNHFLVSPEDVMRAGVYWDDRA